MAPDPAIVKAVEASDYRVTVGDVATKTGLNISQSQQGLLALASDTGATLQVAQSGEIVYQFPKDFRAILRNKFWQLRFQAALATIWGTIFYLIRISFGIVLVLLIIAVALLVIAAIVAILSSGQKSNSDNRSDDRGSSNPLATFYLLRLLSGPDLFWVFAPDYGRRDYYRRDHQRSQGTNQRQDSQPRRAARSQDSPRMSFLEAVFSFLFGDGNPNEAAEERRWQEIATVIRNQQGAVVAEMIAPYLDNPQQEDELTTESFMIPVLSRFNGQPAVSPEGGIIYYFPDLQQTASEQDDRPVPAYFKENLWKFSEAEGSQLTLACGLGVLLLGLSLTLGFFLLSGSVPSGLVEISWLGFWAGLGYSTAYLTVPLIRLLVLKFRNARISRRNEARQARAVALNQADREIRQKIAYARQFAARTVIGTDNLAYSSDRDLLPQEFEQLASDQDLAQ